MQIPPPPPVKPLPFAPARPGAITAVGVLFLVGAFFELFGLTSSPGIPILLSTISMIDTIVFAILLAVVGISLLIWKPWARKAAIYTIIARFVSTVIFLILIFPYMPSPPGIANHVTASIYVMATILYGVYLGILLYFLNRTDAKAAFGEH